MRVFYDEVHDCSRDEIPLAYQLRYEAQYSRILCLGRSIVGLQCDLVRRSQALLPADPQDLLNSPRQDLTVIGCPVRQEIIVIDDELACEAMRVCGSDDQLGRVQLVQAFWLAKDKLWPDELRLLNAWPNK